MAFWREHVLTENVNVRILSGEQKVKEAEEPILECLEDSWEGWFVRWC